MIKSSFYTTREEKWECVGIVLWSGKHGEEPWKDAGGFLMKGYGRVDDYCKEVLEWKIDTL